MAIQTGSGIKIRINNVDFEVPAREPQLYKIEIRKTADPDEDEYYLIVNSAVMILSNGYIPQDIVISGLTKNTSYTVRFSNVIEKDKVFKKQLTTGIPYNLGDNPFFNKEIIAGQSHDIYYSGMLTDTLPELKQGVVYYTLESNYREAYSSYKNLIPSGGVRLQSFQDVTDNHYETGAYFPTENATMYTSTDGGFSDSKTIPAKRIFDGDGNGFSFFAAFYMTSLPSTGKNHYIFYYADGEPEQNAFKVFVSPDGKINIASFVAGTQQLITSDSALFANKWYKLFFKINQTDPTQNYCQVDGYGYHEYITFSQKNNLTQLPTGSEELPVYLGTHYDWSNSVMIGSSGLAIKRIWIMPTYLTDNNIFYALTGYLGYNVQLALKDTETNQVSLVDTKWNKKLDDTVLSVSIPPDTPEGSYKIYAVTPKRSTPEISLQIKRFKKDTVGFDINFESDFEGARVALPTIFAALHKRWGGANGGTTGDNIWAHEPSRSLVLEQHGDNYNGNVQGVAKEIASKDSKWYGNPLMHDNPNDPKFGKPWVHRVGACIVSKQYYGYGEFLVRMKIPQGTYGVAPCPMWTFHYIEQYPTDPRYQGWIDKGFIPYGGSDPYLVINNEIDIELPSHKPNFVFATWDEQRLAYFAPKALDNKFMIGIDESEPDASKRGLYVLNNPGQPKEFSSWTKVANTFTRKHKPSYDTCKFNNWIGELGGGYGIAYSQSEYEAEQYLALMTDLGHNYADGEFHDWVIKWYKDRTELWIDGSLKRTNRMFVPFIPGRLTIGGWFPSGVNVDASETPWLPNPLSAWAGYPADFKTLNLEVQRIKHTPYDDATAGGANELVSESYPQSGMRELIV